jgi:hypothetical protein
MNSAVRRCSLFAVLAIIGSLVVSGAEPPYSISISALKDVVKAGSDIRIVIALKNISDHEIKVPRSPGTELGERSNDIEVVDERGTAVPESKYYRVIRGKDAYNAASGPVDKSSPAPIFAQEESTIVSTLRPGETLVDGMLVNKMADLTHPGRYTIRVRRRDNTLKTPVTSNSITVTVIN